MQPRNIAIFCDGTGNEVGASGETNVVKLYRCAVKDKGQICYYHPGVGTISDFSFSLVRQFQLKLHRISSMATGFGAEEAIEDAYRFLMNNYRPGDHLFLFGFSRGAFTVRALSGMIGYIGLLHPGLDHLVHYAQRIFFDAPTLRNKNRSLQEERTRQNKETAHKFKSMFAREDPVQVWFIGVWDTVQSIGLFGKEIPSDPTLKPHVQNARHAVAIDETRDDYKPRLWRTTDPDVEFKLKQVWFAGVHSDVGGSYAEPGLSNITLQWMAAEAEQQDFCLHKKMLNEFKPNPFAPLHDEIKHHWFWRMRPMSPRIIGENVLLHESVVARMQAPEMHYSPRNLPETYRVERTNARTTTASTGEIINNYQLPRSDP